MSLQNLPGVASHSGSKTESTYSLWFEVAAATLNESFGHQDHHLNVDEIPKHIVSRSIGLTLRYFAESNPVGVTLSDGTRLRDIAGNCHILPRTPDKGSNAAVGVMHHIPSFEHKDPIYDYSYPSLFRVELYLPENQFNDIVSNLRGGKLPSSFQVKVRGMSLPTEFQYEWDVKESPKLPVVYFWASFVAAVDYSINTESKAWKQTLEPSYYPASRADFVTLLQMLKTQSEQTERLAGKVAWVAIGVLCIAVVLVWRLFSQ